MLEREKNYLADLEEQKKKLSKSIYAQHLYENKNTPIKDACKTAGLSKSTFYRIELYKKTK